VGLLLFLARLTAFSPQIGQSEVTFSFITIARPSSRPCIKRDSDWLAAGLLTPPRKIPKSAMSEYPRKARNDRYGWSLDFLPTATLPP
jgi:hypothetical protein